MRLSWPEIRTRARYPGTKLADLYDCDLMKPDLHKAHHARDAVVDRLYRPTPFASDTARVEHLFGLYEKLMVPLITSKKRVKHTKSG